MQKTKEEMAARLIMRKWGPSVLQSGRGRGGGGACVYFYNHAYWSVIFIWNYNKCLLILFRTNTDTFRSFFVEIRRVEFTGILKETWNTLLKIASVHIQERRIED